MPQADHTKHEEKLKEELKEKNKELKKLKSETRSLESRFKKEAGEFRKQFAKKTLDLMTAGFGLVAALAWNGLIQEIIKTYIQPFLGESSGVISQLIYALFVTALAVFVTYQLGKVAEEEEN
jgi:hypothetical protein